MPRCLLALVLFASPASADEPTVAALVKQLETGSPTERVVAAELLGERGPAARIAADALADVALRTKLIAGEDADSQREARAQGFLFDACRITLRNMGPKAAPSLAQLLRHESNYARILVANDLAADPKAAGVALPWLITCLGEPFAPLVESAADAIGIVGPQAESAIPALASVFRGPPLDGNPEISGGIERTRKVVAAALVKIGPKAHPAIRNEVLPLVAAQLADPDPKALDHAVGLLSILGDLGEPAAPALAARMRRKGVWSLRELDVLLTLGPAGRTAFAAFARDAAGENKSHVLAALHRAPPDVVEPHVPLLRDTAKTGVRNDRAIARDALARVGPKYAAEVVELLRPNARWHASELLGLGDAGIRAVVELLDHETPAVRVAVAQTLGGYWPDAQTTENPDAGIPVVDIVPLWTGPKQFRPAVPALRRVARTDPDPLAAAAAAMAATALSLDAADLAPLTDRKLLDTPDPEVRAEIAEMRRPFIPRPPAVRPTVAMVPFLVACLHTQRDFANWVWRVSGWLGVPLEDLPTFRVRVAYRIYNALADLGPLAKDAVPTLVSQLGAENTEAVTQDFILKALRAIGPGAKEAVPALLAALRNPVGSSTFEILDMLGEIGPSATEAVPELMTSATDPDDPSVIRAIQCLGRIGPGAAAAAPALRKVLGDPDPGLRLAAAFALARIENDLPTYRRTIVRLARHVAERERFGVLDTESSGDAFPAVVVRAVIDLPPDLPELLPLALPNMAGRSAVRAICKAYGPRAVPACVGLLRDSSIMYVSVQDVIEVLGDIGPAARDALPELRRVLAEDDFPAAAKARDAIRKIEGK